VENTTIEKAKRFLHISDFSVLDNGLPCGRFVFLVGGWLYKLCRRGIIQPPIKNMKKEKLLDVIARAIYHQHEFSTTQFKINKTQEIFNWCILFILILLVSYLTFR
jgi:hypothetical protein